MIISVRSPSGAVTREIDPSDLHLWQAAHAHVEIVDGSGAPAAAPPFPIVAVVRDEADE